MSELIMRVTTVISLRKYRPTNKNSIFIVCVDVIVSLTHYKTKYSRCLFRCHVVGAVGA